MANSSWIIKLIGEEGYYALCEGSKLRDPADICKLSKNVDIIISESGFQFWYYMYGTQIGTLELIVDNNVILSLTGRQKPEWMLAQVKLPAGNYLVA